MRHAAEFAQFALHTLPPVPVPVRAARMVCHRRFLLGNLGRNLDQCVVRHLNVLLLLRQPQSRALNLLLALLNQTF